MSGHTDDDLTPGARDDVARANQNMRAFNAGQPDADPPKPGGTASDEKLASILNAPDSGRR